MRLPISNIAGLWMAAVVGALTACGGEGPAPQHDGQAVADSRASPGAYQPAALRQRALAIGPNDPVDAQAWFDWAAFKFPTVFPSNPTALTLADGGVTFTIRAYANGNYLGVTQTGAVYGLGPFTGNLLVPLGQLADFTTLVRADLCGVYPASCPTPPPPSQLNECQPITARSLVAGTRIHLEYALEGPAAGTVVQDWFMDGPATFQGQNAFLLRMTQTATAGGLGSASTETRFYLDDAGGGLILTLGREETTTVGTSSLSSRTVFDPPYLDEEFTLPSGQSLTRTIRSTTTPTAPPGIAVRGAETETITFAARETITLFGKSYDTCRYVENQVGASGPFTSWYQVGTGLVVQLDASGGRLKLRQGTFNGNAL